MHLILAREAGTPRVAGDLFAQEWADIEAAGTGGKGQTQTQKIAAAHKAPWALYAALHPLDELSGAPLRSLTKQSNPREPDIRMRDKLFINTSALQGVVTLGAQNGGRV